MIDVKCCDNCWMLEKELTQVRQQLAEARAQASQATDLMVKGESLRSKIMLQAILGEFPPKLRGKEMTSTHKQIIDKTACTRCNAAVGQLCRNKKGGDMKRDVHSCRMICPVCGKRYDERSGNGFRHWSLNGNVWHRLDGNGA